MQPPYIYMHSVRNIVASIFTIITSFSVAQVPVFQVPSAPIPGGYRPAGLRNPTETLQGSGNAQAKSADQEIRRHQKEILDRQAQLEEIEATFASVHIDYEFPENDNPGTERYHDALAYFGKVLKGDAPMSLEKAVFTVERAFDPSLSYEEFSRQLSDAVSIIGLQMQRDKIPATDNLGKILTAFRFMTDTLRVRSKQAEQVFTSFPKIYDFDDFWGRQDYRKMFVSKLMREGTGQCHSLPLYFLLLCERMKAEAYLAFAPNHSFIKFQDNRGHWHNMELTNGILASDHFMVQTGYIKAEAIQNNLYLQPLTKKQTIVQCLNDLTSGYIKQFGYDQFVRTSTTLAFDNEKNSLSAHQMLVNYFTALDNFVRYQYKQKKLSKEFYRNDEKARAISSAVNGGNKFIENLGFADMPQEAYEAWLRSAQTEAARRQHQKELKVLGSLIKR